MTVNPVIFKELIKRGYSVRGKTRVWDVSDSKLWYLTPHLSKHFLDLFKYEPYRKAVVDRESKLLKVHTSKIVKMFGEKKFNLIDLGCGGGVKTSIFIKNLPFDVKIRYCPVDISPYFIKKATQRIKSLGSENIVEHKPFISDFEDLDDIVGILKGGDYQKNLILLLGETISHYDINDFLYKLSEDMFQGDTIVIGNGLMRDKNHPVSVEKYKSSLFNEWFVHVLEGLGFKAREVEYDARFANGRLEGFYRIKAGKKIKHKSKNVYFKKGDEVIVGIDYKFPEKEMKKFCKMYFGKVEFILDNKGEYVLAVCKK